MMKNIKHTRHMCLTAIIGTIIAASILTIMLNYANDQIQQNKETLLQVVTANQQTPSYRKLNSNLSDPKTIEPKSKSNNEPSTAQHIQFYLHKEIEEGGRLGNMMFQWASIMGIAELHQLIPCHVSNTGMIYWHEMLEAFEGPFPDCPDDSKSIIYKWNDKDLDNMIQHLHSLKNSPSTTTNYPELFSSFQKKEKKGNIGIVEPTYLEKYNYFQHIPQKVMKTFHIQDKYQKKADQYLQQFTSNSKAKIIKIGIHVRRGDLEHLQEMTFLKQSQYLVSPDFYENAMVYFRRRFNTHDNNNNNSPPSKVLFFVASNTMSWCKNQTIFKNQDDVIFLPETSEQTPILDFTVLTHMDHLIVSFGTFSWWAAYLLSMKNYRNNNENKDKSIVLYHDPITVNNDVLPSWIHIPDEPNMFSNYETYEKYFKFVS